MYRKLKGQELIDHIQQSEGIDQAALIESAGYTVIRNGKVSLKRTEFMLAMAEAQGLNISEVPHTREVSQREPSFMIKVSSRGIIPLSNCYARMLDVGPGDYVTIEQEDGYLVLGKKEEEQETSQPAGQAAYLG